MPRPIPPCVPDCSGRSAVCHATCGKYAQYAEITAAYNSRRYADQRLRDEAIQVMMDSRAIRDRKNNLPRKGA